MKRPWAGHQEAAAQQCDQPDFDPTNPLCPGVARANGEVNIDQKKKVQNLPIAK